MKKAYYYFFIIPLRQFYEDGKKIKPKFTIPIETRTKTYEVSLFLTKNTVYMMRIMIPNLNEEKITEYDAKLIQIIKEHMLSVLKVTYDNEISLFRPVWVFRDENELPALKLNITEKINPNFEVNYKNIKSTYCATFKIRHQLRLLSDGQDDRIPLQFRFLSLYKLLELEFKTKGHFKKDELPKFLSKFEEEFKNLKLSNRKLEKYIHEIRDKCAHIKDSKETFGVTHLDQKSAMDVEIFLPLFLKICSFLLNEKYRETGFTLVQLVPKGNF